MCSILLSRMCECHVCTCIYICSGGAKVKVSKRVAPVGEGTGSEIPVVPFDMDLYHWDNPEGKPPPIKRVW